LSTIPDTSLSEGQDESSWALTRRIGDFPSKRLYAIHLAIRKLRELPPARNETKTAWFAKVKFEAKSSNLLHVLVSLRRDEKNTLDGLRRLTISADTSLSAVIRVHTASIAVTNSILVSSGVDGSIAMRFKIKIKSGTSTEETVPPLL
jgi:hypothetical protein